MADIASQRLRRKWDAYLQTSVQCPQQKFSKLSSFLKLYLFESKDLESPALALQFSDMNSVSNLLTREFLSDIHRICSSHDKAGHLARDEAEDDLTELKSYLLSGRGWMILRSVNTAGVEGLTCSRDLADLLVSLLEFSCQFPYYDTADVQDNAELPAIDYCLRSVHMKSDKRNASTGSQEEADSPIYFGGKAEGGRGRCSNGMSDSDSDASPQVSSLHSKLQASRDVISKLFHRQVSTTDEDVEMPYEENDELFRTKSAMEISVLILTLLEKLCQADYSKSRMSQSICISILPHLLQIVSSFQTDDYVYPEGWTCEMVTYLQRCMMRVIVGAAGMVSCQQNGIAMLSASGVMLTLADVTRFCLNKIQQCSIKSTHLCEHIQMLYLSGDFVQGMLLILEVVFKNLPSNISFLNNALKLLVEFFRKGGLQLVEDLISLLEKTESESCLSQREIEKLKEVLSELVSYTGRVIDAFKTSKVNYIHAVQCGKKKHRKCEYKRYLHHHHDILRLALFSHHAHHISFSEDKLLNESENAEQQECSVAMLADFQLKLFQNSKVKGTRVGVLQSLEKIGLCCCMQPSRIIKCLMYKFTDEPSCMRNYIMAVLCKVLLSQCGGAQLIQDKLAVSACICASCYDSRLAEDKSNVMQPSFSKGVFSTTRTMSENSDSALSSSEISLPDENTSCSSRWRCLNHFLPLILHRDQSVSVQVTKHLLRLVGQGSYHLKQELFYGVFLPTLQAARQNKVCNDTFDLQIPSDCFNSDEEDNGLSSKPGEAGHLTEDSKDTWSNTPSCCVVQYCLSALPQLLQTKPSQHLFLNHGGVNQLCQLLQNQTFQRSVLKSFEVLIITEEHKKHIPRDHTDFRLLNRTMACSASCPVLTMTGDQWRAEATAASTEGSDTLHSDLEGSEPDLVSAGVSVIETFLSFLFQIQSSSEKSEQLTACTANDSSKESEHLERNPCEQTDNNHPYSDFCPTTKDCTSSHTIPADFCTLVLITNMWDTCETLLSHSNSFRNSFLDRNGFHLAFELLKETIKDLGMCISTVQEDETKFYRKSSWPCNAESRYRSLLGLCQSLLSVCLCCSAGRQVIPSTVSVEFLLETVQTLLVKHIDVKETNIHKTLCDYLLNATVVHKSIKDILHNSTFAVMHLKADDCVNDEDMLYMSDSCSTSEGCTDQGYVADTESDTDLNDKEVSSSKRSTCEFASLIPDRAVNHVLYPEACVMVLRWLCAHVRAQPHLQTSLSHLLYQLIFLSQQSKHNLAVLYQEGTVSILLEDLDFIFSSESSSNEVERMLILDLILVLTQSEMSSSELTCLLKMFHNAHAPRSPLLSTLIALIENFKPCPSHFLTFPLAYPDHKGEMSDMEVLVRSVDSDILTASIRPSHLSPPPETDPDYANLIRMGGVQEAIDFQSCTSMDSMFDENHKIFVSPISLMLKNSFTWPANQKGFSFSFWIHSSTDDKKSKVLTNRRLKRSEHSTVGLKRCASDDSIAVKKCVSLGLKAVLNRSTGKRREWNCNCVHVLSVYSKPMCFQVWSDPSKGNLVFRLMKVSKSEEEILDEVALTNVLKQSNWQHLTLTFTEKTVGARTFAKICAVVDGYKEQEVCMEYHSVVCMTSADAAHPSCLSLGHMTNESNSKQYSGTVKISSIMLFNDCVLNKESSFHLFCMGPNCTELSLCDALDRNIQYNQHLSHDLLNQSKLDFDILTGTKEINLNAVRENLVLVFNPKSESSITYNLYNQSVPTKENNKRVLSFRKKDVGFNAYIQMPGQLQAHCSSLVNISPEQHHDFDKVIDEIGGIGSFLYLYAKVVEQNSSEKEQAKALLVLFTLLKQSTHHRAAFRQISGYKMLVKVMVNSRSIMGYHALNTLLKNCLSRPIISYDSRTQTYSLNADSSAVIQDAHVIDHLLLEWRIWQRSEVSVWRMALQVLEVMISDQHPHQEFNMRQLQRIHVVNKLLLMCLERTQEGYPCLPAAICDSIVKLTKCMLGYPPDTGLLSSVCDFLLLMHPAASTFVCHLPAGFYFTHKWANLSSPLFKKGKYRYTVKTSSTQASSRRSDTVTVISRINQDSKTTQEGKENVKRSASCPIELHPFYIETSESECVLSTSFEDQAWCGVYPAVSVEQQASVGVAQPASHEQQIDADSLHCKTDDSETLVVTEESSVTDNNQSSSDLLSADTNNANSQNMPCSELDLPQFGQDAYAKSNSLNGKRSTSSHQDSEHKSALKNRSTNHVHISDSEISFGSQDVKTENIVQSLQRLELESDLFKIPKSEKLLCNLPSELQIEECDSLQCRDSVDENNIGILVSRSVNENNDLNSISNVANTPNVLSAASNRVSDSCKNDDQQNPLEIDMKNVTDFKKTSLRAEHLSPGGISLGSDWELITDPLSLHNVPGDLDQSTDQENEPDTDSGNVKVCCGLLELVAHCLVLLPDSSLSVAMTTVRPEMLLVMVHHKEPCMRTAVVKLLDVYLHRASAEQIERFIKIQGFHLLANQLHQHPATPPLLDACFTIMLGQPHRFDVNFSGSLVQEMSAVQQLAVVPVLALLENSVHHVSLCHNTLCSLIQMFETVAQMPQTMLDNGLVETLCNVLHTLNVCTAEAAAGEAESQHQTLVEDVQHFFRLIAERTFQTNGANQYQAFDDLLATLQKLENTEKRIHGLNSEAVENVRDVQLHALECVIENVHARFIVSNDKSGFAQSSSLRQGGKSLVSQGELLERYKKIIVMAVDMVLLSEILQPPTSAAKRRLQKLVGGDIEVVPYQTEFQRSLLEFIMSDIIVGMERSFFRNKKSALDSFMWNCKDVLRIQFSRLLPHMLSSHVSVTDRLFAVELLTAEAKCKELLRSTLNVNMAGQRLSVYLYQLLLLRHASVTGRRLECVELLLDMLVQAGWGSLRPVTTPTKEVMYHIQEDNKIWDTELKKERQVWNRKKEMSYQRTMSKMDVEMKRISDHGMEVTQVVVNMQNLERKKFIEHIKLTLTNNVHIKKSWHSLTQQLSHERAVWYNTESHPQSWQLDPTEGPCRVRRRLMPCHLGIKSKYLLPDEQAKLESEHHEAPLSYLFGEDNQSSDSAALIYRLHTNEKIRLTERCYSVTPFHESRGELLLGEHSVYFVGDEAILDPHHSQLLHDEKEVCSMTLPHEDIKEIHRRWYQLQDNALEIFLTNGKTCLLSFMSSKERDLVYQHLDEAELPSRISCENLTAIQQLWLEARITNFEYLTQLNKMAGRSFNDLMQYPVFPFVLSQYTDAALDMHDTNSYRDLSKPISVQNKSREKKYLENYKWLEQENLRSDYHQKDSLVASAETLSEPYHYGSHYSNSGTVLHFLVRLPPFTKMFLSYQDQNFDLPDRTFHSMHTAWRLASYESTTDVKELIPEFFFLPEFLCNNEGFDFGIRQVGERVHHVELPGWCKNDARLFMLIHRQVLESRHVTQHLHEWIDLVFGYKQTGQAAINAINVFHPATYFGVDVDSIKEPLRRQALLTMIQTYGQTPKQLFRSPHPANGQMAPTATNVSKKTAHKTPDVLSTVAGLQWGNYIGSPDCAEPVLTWMKSHKAGVSSLVSLPTGEVFGLAPKSCLLVMYSKEKGVTALNTVDVLWAGIVSWGHPDSIIRIKNKKDRPPVNFIPWDGIDQVTCCASMPDCRLLFFGGSSGVITVYNTKFSPEKLCDIAVYGKQWHMYGHHSAITALHVCRAYSVLISASQDGTCIIWDLNRLCYVRSITDCTRPVQSICVSETLGDIVSVSHSNTGSTLMLHTINAQFVASIHCPERIHCVTYSSAPEGRAVNVIAGGLHTGTIRLWSSWDLSEVREIIVDPSPMPIISITFAQDNQRLYAANAEGKVFMFIKASQSKQKMNNHYYISFL